MDNLNIHIEKVVFEGSELRTESLLAALSSDGRIPEQTVIAIGQAVSAAVATAPAGD